MIPTTVYIELLNQYLEFNRYWVNQYIAYMNLYFPNQDHE